MMQSMRDNMKLVIWITAIIFLVGFGILQLGGVLNEPARQGPVGVVAEINGDKVRYQDFMAVYQDMVRQVQQERPLQEGEDSYIREQAWQQIVREHLIRQQVERHGIKITPDEIKTAIRFAPPSFVFQAPLFQTDGKFDYKKYLAELDNPNSQVPWEQVEAMVADQLPVQKLQNYIASTAKVSDGDVRDRFLLLNEGLDLNVLRFEPDSFAVDTSLVTKADVQAYYKAHPDQFSGPTKVQLAVALERRAPIEEDFAIVRERLQKILDDVRAEPDSFPGYARTYSEIQSAGRGGEAPGDARIQDLRPAFRDAFQKAQPGDITPILREERSLHIFKIEKRYMDPKVSAERFHYREIALRVNPGPEAIRRARAAVEAFLKDAHKAGVIKAATQHGVQTVTSAWFARGQSQNEVFQRFPEVETWCFQAKEGSISRPIPHENGWYIYQILHRRPAGLRPLEEVAGEVKAAAVRSLRTERAKEAAGRARAAILAGMSPEEAAKQFGGRFAHISRVTRNGVLSGIGRDAESVGSFLSIQEGAWSPVREGPSGVLLAQVVQHDRPTEEEFKAQEAKLRQSLIAERQRVILTEWYDSIRRRAKIEDYREEIFGA
jgi:peptidyl-prolyl cis-trans isomerase D